MNEYHVVFYATSTGKEPAKEFIESLPTRAKAKALRDLSLLQEVGPGLREPFSKHMADGVFELRVNAGGDAARMFYFFFSGQQIVITNGFLKKTQKTPPRELARALKYKKDWEVRHRGNVS
ncbi:type II toxin-antitoxin system RelE/ParE family toxin [Adlercreutzia sp. ZJ473]|uniref:type II toxin-antitoxin system RelE/ParE family toxin n=1 Tax=Adlercreutzia sp. ZJ473 TaxID=2722822 RepID=UPI0015558E92